MAKTGQKGLMLILSAPSGTGKTTLARRLAAETPDSIFSVSVTTRAPRGDERDGVDYHFFDRAAFDRMVTDGKFIEWAEVHGNRYGTPTEFARMALDQGKLAIFDIDVQGGVQIKTKYREAVTVFLLPPSLDELEKRLRSRGTDREGVVRRRLDAAKAEIRAGLEAYDYAIINEDFDRAYADLQGIVQGLRGPDGSLSDEITTSLRPNRQELQRFMST